MADVATLEKVCRQIPKADLHLHLDGSVRPQTVVDLAKGSDKALDLATAEKRMRVGSERASLVEYLTKFPFVNALLQTPEAVRRVARELVEDCAKDEVKIAEVRFCPLLHTNQGAGGAEILEAVLEGIAEGKAATGIRGGVIVCCLREMGPDRNNEIAELAIRFKERGVVALDLAGNEAEYDAKNALQAFDAAGRAGLRRIAHAGEAAGSESIRQAIDVLMAERIGHGTKLVADPKMLAEVAQRGIPLEVCITSNVQTRAVSDVSGHPFARYLRAGVKVTINTDNRTVSSTTATRELATAWHWGELTRDELRRLVMNGVDASFLPSEEKAAARDEFAAKTDDVMARAEEIASGRP